MPIFMTSVAGTPIVFNAYMQHISYDDLQETFEEIQKLIKKNGQVWLILDWSAWEITRQALASLVGALADRKPGSPYDSRVVPLLVSTEGMIDALSIELKEHAKRFEMIPFESLDEAYEFASKQIH